MRTYIAIHIIHMYMHNIYFCIGIAILEKHYNNLLMSLPDHVITLERLHDINMYEIQYFDQIISSVKPCWSNKEIFNALISLTANDYQLLGLSFLIERLSTGDILISDCPNIQSYRNG